MPKVLVFVVMFMLKQKQTLKPVLMPRLMPMPMPKRRIEVTLMLRLRNEIMDTLSLHKMGV